MPKKLKKFKGIQSPEITQGNKIGVSDNNTPNPNIDYPIFCFKYLNKDFGLVECTDNQKAKLIDRLAVLSKMTWHQIQFAPKHGLGSEKISMKVFKNKKIPSICEDVEHLIALRFDGKAPFVGHRGKGNIFHIFYIDRNFTLYNHG